MQLYLFCDISFSNLIVTKESVFPLAWKIKKYIYICQITATKPSYLDIMNLLISKFWHCSNTAKCMSVFYLASSQCNQTHMDT